MKKVKNILGIIAIMAIIGVSFIACDNGTTGDGGSCNASCLAIGATGEGGGKIIYHNHAGFTVTDTGSFKAYYLEAAPANHGTSLAWAPSTSPAYQYVAGAAGTAIGTGKANTAAILAVDANAPAAKACADYNGGSKTDWFLPSRDELNEMYKARTHLGISSGFFWSSSQIVDYGGTNAWLQYLDDGSQCNYFKDDLHNVRAIRAF